MDGRDKPGHDGDHWLTSTNTILIHEGIVHEDGVLALRAGREQRHRRADQLLEPPHIFDALGGKLGPDRAPRVDSVQPSIVS